MDDDKRIKSGTRAPRPLGTEHKLAFECQLCHLDSHSSPYEGVEAMKAMRGWDGLLACRSEMTFALICTMTGARGIVVSLVWKGGW